MATVMPLVRMASTLVNRNCQSNMHPRPPSWTYHRDVTPHQRCHMLPHTPRRYIACGSFHTVAVTDDAVYSWGQGQFGALGHGSYEDRAVPSRIRALAGKDIEKVACGSFHTLLLRRDGVVYGCGLAKHGQLPGAMHRMSADKVAPLPVKVRWRAVEGAAGNGNAVDAGAARVCGIHGPLALCLPHALASLAPGC